MAPFEFRYLTSLYFDGRFTQSQQLFSVKAGMEKIMSSRATARILSYIANDINKAFSVQLEL